jgi:chromate transport protein ChrA
MVMVLSFIFLRARYKIINFMGVALSIVGILSLILADIRGSRAGRGEFVGVALSIVGILVIALLTLGGRYADMHAARGGGENILNCMLESS